MVIRGGIIEDRADDQLRKRAKEAEVSIGLSVARVLEIRADRTSILILPGSAKDNSALLERGLPTPTA